jgi:glycosyltransferase involved in cell wall biosynthesis
VGDPRVSAVVACRDHARYVEQAVRSLTEQTWRDLEVVVVDDGSEDGSADVVERIRDPRVSVVRTSRRGASAAANAGIARARGEFVARLDADDISHPDRIRLQVRYLDAHPECVAVASWFEHIDSAGRVLGSVRAPTDPDELADELRHRRNLIAHSSLLVRRAAFEAAGGYREDLDVALDVDMILRLLEHGKIGCVDAYLCRWRIDLRAGPDRMAKHRRQKIAATAARAAAERRRLGLPEDFAGMLARAERQMGGDGPHMGQRRFVAGHYCAYGVSYLDEGETARARRRLARAVAADPSFMRAWAFLAVSFLPAGLRRRLRAAARTRGVLRTPR